MLFGLVGVLKFLRIEARDSRGKNCCMFTRSWNPNGVRVELGETQRNRRVHSLEIRSSHARKKGEKIGIQNENSQYIFRFNASLLVLWLAAVGWILENDIDDDGLALYVFRFGEEKGNFSRLWPFLELWYSVRDEISSQEVVCRASGKLVVWLKGVRLLFDTCWKSFNVIRSDNGKIDNLKFDVNEVWRK